VVIWYLVRLKNRLAMLAVLFQAGSGVAILCFLLNDAMFALNSVPLQRDILQISNIDVES
jgi:hypothetical protein